MSRAVVTEVLNEEIGSDRLAAETERQPIFESLDSWDGNDGFVSDESRLVRIYDMVSRRVFRRPIPSLSAAVVEANSFNLNGLDYFAGLVLAYEYSVRREFISRCEQLGLARLGTLSVTELFGTDDLDRLIAFRPWASSDAVWKAVQRSGFAFAGPPMWIFIESPFLTNQREVRDWLYVSWLYPAGHAKKTFPSIDWSTVRPVEPSEEDSGE